MMEVMTIPCHPTNYRRGRVSPVRYVVIHYVGALGGAEDNARYFAGAGRGASAHFFVGFAGEVFRSVAEEDSAWHCGGGRQGSSGGAFFGRCRNDNSIGIELCVRKRDPSSLSGEDRDWYFEKATLESAARLTAEMLTRYDIGIDGVIRHYDVTGKICPASFVQDEEQWQAFLEEVKKQMRYQTVEQVPSWGRETVEKLIGKGYLTGSGLKDAQGRPADLNLTEDMLRLLVINDRAGLYP